MHQNLLIVSFWVLNDTFFDDTGPQTFHFDFLFSVWCQIKTSGGYEFSDYE